ncbi:MAG: nitrous oxide-stimulated promoter family protein [Aliarcobacter sp.]|nr:nitrous oxide-stimulated promoter family protein [Aliarcobacter sp.]
MTSEKFEIEINTLKSFFEIYCKDKHQNLNNENITLEYKEKKFNLDICLCTDCHNAINYSFKRLQLCPHEIKPRCRTCSTPCYEKPRWKNTAKIMIYSAMKLSLSKMKSKVKNIFTS